MESLAGQAAAGQAFEEIRLERLENWPGECQARPQGLSGEMAQGSREPFAAVPFPSPSSRPSRAPSGPGAVVQARVPPLSCL